MSPGPDFPDGRRHRRAAREHRGSLPHGARLLPARAKWAIEDLGRGQWQIVVTEIPYQVQKSKLIERLAELIQTKKVPILADVRDESAEDVRIVLEPRARTVDPEMLMGMLFRNSDLEVRFSLNMNVLIDGRTPKVCSMKEVLRAWLDHRREVLIRRSTHRMEKIDHRLEVLEGFITAYLTSTASSTSSATTMTRRPRSCARTGRGPSSARPPRRTMSRRRRGRGNSPRCRSTRSSTCGSGRSAASRRWSFAANSRR
jgi:DNA gyrase/topoisomerase IV subunit A